MKINLNICIILTFLIYINNIKLDLDSIKINEPRENIIDLEFISYSQLRYIIEILHQSSVVKILPKEFISLIEDIYYNNSEFNYMKNKNILEKNYTDEYNHPESFVDDNGILNVQGFLTQINIKANANNLYFCTVNKYGLNVFPNQKKQSLLRSIKTDNAIVNNVLYSPCFIINHSEMFCAENVEDKDKWISFFN